MERLGPAAAGDSEASPPNSPGRPAIRRNPAMRLLRCVYDVRPLFEAKPGDEPAEPPLERDMPLAIVLPPNAEQLQILELLPVIFDLLAALEDWSPLTGLGIPPALDDVVHDLAVRGLIEVNP
jgi:hypothetical protein